LPRDSLERVFGGELFPQIGGLALGGGVKVGFQLLAQLFALFPRVAQGDFGIDANGEGFFLASLPIPHPPILPAIEVGPQVKAIAIVELADTRPIAGGVLTFGSGQQDS
jgi:hypothetical protein